ncbi:hypothetical protein B0H14DRAFT_2923276 [Mycena olivaceomarginata]|nr:hypothetical protein B0H14DRAFT_2923276 [Mycena olivaceomarginata]
MPGDARPLVGVEIGPAFPPELERELFETAAVVHPATIPALLRVAKRVLLWIEPCTWLSVCTVTIVPWSLPCRKRCNWNPRNSFARPSATSPPGGCVFDDRREAAAATLHGIIDITVDYDFTSPMFLPFIAEMRVERLAMDLEELFEFRSINLAHPGTPGCSVAACTHPPRSGPLYTSQKCAGSDTEVEPPSPGGSIKGLYVRSRPTSMDGSIIEFPGFAFEVDFTQFGMTAAPAATVTSPIEPSFPFPTPPIIRAPPVAKRRRYAASMKSLYTGTGTGMILKTNLAPIIPVKIVPRVEDEPAMPLPAKTSGWKALKKIVPSPFRRPIGDRAPAHSARCHRERCGRCRLSGTHPPSPHSLPTPSILHPPPRALIRRC